MTIITSDIDRMPAGRELDGLVAVRLFKWRLVPKRVINDRDFGPGLWAPDMGDPKHPNAGAHALGCPFYSTDIQSAWAIAERFYPYIKVDGRGIDPENNSRWAVTIWTGYSEITAYGETAPLALSRAALKVAFEESDRIDRVVRDVRLPEATDWPKLGDEK